MCMRRSISGYFSLKPLEPRQQPLLQERRERRDHQRAGATIRAGLVEGAFELLEPPANARQQARPFWRELHHPPAAIEQRGARDIPPASESACSPRPR